MGGEIEFNKFKRRQKLRTVDVLDFAAFVDMTQHADVYTMPRAHTVRAYKKWLASIVDHFT